MINQKDNNKQQCKLLLNIICGTFGTLAKIDRFFILVSEYYLKSSWAYQQAVFSHLVLGIDCFLYRFFFCQGIRNFITRI